MSFTQDIPETEIKPGQINFFYLSLPFSLPSGNRNGRPTYAEQSNAIEELGYEISSILISAPPGFFERITAVARKKFQVPNRLRSDHPLRDDAPF